MEATLIYPHQLAKTSPALAIDRPVYLIEESLLLTHNPIHRQKLILHKLSLDAYQQYLENEGYTVHRISIATHPSTTDVWATLRNEGITTVHVADTNDDYLERAIATSGLTRVWYESPLFILAKDEALERFAKSKKFMASFYKQLRIDHQILVDDQNEPTGGQWSFDADNRKKLPKDVVIPEDIACSTTPDIAAATAWAAELEAEQYGEAGCWLPYTFADAEQFLEEFLRVRFADFGTYEDAMTTRGVRLFHSTLSPLLNIGLLAPQHVLDAALAYALENDVPLNSLEGFVRQILGWREFIRASYECDGRAMRQQNFFNHTRPLPDSFWTGTTNIIPVDHAIETALDYGYNHHIERLMVLGNFMLLCQINPTDVYRWFMGMYVDAYDWVMVPNVYGMSQFADGGSFATKPYISGSNYLRKMSDYPKGEWEDTWTALYWHFIATHHDVFTKNHRMSMMPRLLAKMDTTKKAAYVKLAATYLEQESA